MGGRGADQLYGAEGNDTISGALVTISHMAV
nr:hypothetical protein [Enterovibrio nigricans]